MGDKKVLIFGKAGCARCITTKDKVGHFISKWQLEPEVPVVFYDMDTFDGMAEGAFHDVWEVPTTIVAKGKSTIARINGEVPQSEWLRASLMA